MEWPALIAIFFALNIIILFLIGALFFNKRPAIENLDSFLNTLTQEKLRYYIDFSKLSKNHNNLRIRVYEGNSVLRDICYIIGLEGLTKTDKECNDIVIVLDDHAIGTMMIGSFYPKEVLLSELITGHLRVQGIGVGDIFSMKF